MNLSLIEKIKKEVSILEVLKLNGIEATGKSKEMILCFSHDEKTASCRVDNSNNSFNCYGCERWGDSIDAHAIINDLDPKDAIKDLASKLGIRQDTPVANKEQKFAKKLVWTILGYFQYQLKSGRESEKAQQYLNSRGLKADTSKAFRLGFAKNSKRALSSYIQKKLPDSYQQAEEFLLDNKLLKREEGKLIDVLRNRLVFPLCTPSGELIGFSGRKLPDSYHAAPKYLTVIFNGHSKSEVLYGFNQNSDLAETESCIGVEGYTDVMRCYQYGYHSVALQGTSINELAVSAILRSYTSIPLALDPDQAGKKATMTTIKALIRKASYNHSFYVCEIPEGKDVDELNAGELAKSLKEKEQAQDWVETNYIELTQTDSSCQNVEAYIDWVELIEDPLVYNLWNQKLKKISKVKQWELEWQWLWILCWDIINNRLSDLTLSRNTLEKLNMLKDIKPANIINKAITQGVCSKHDRELLEIKSRRFPVNRVRNWTDEKISSVLESAFISTCISKLQGRALDQEEKAALVEVLKQ